MQELPDGPTARELLEEDRNRLEHRVWDHELNRRAGGITPSDWSSAHS